MLLKKKDFLIEEKEAPLLQKDEGYLDSVGPEEVCDRSAKWLSSAGVGEELKGKTAKWLEELQSSKLPPPRIVVLDAVRTFRGAEQRRLMERFLTAYLARACGSDDFSALSDDEAMREYHQGLGYLSSFLLLSLPADRALALLWHCRESERFLPGYWRHEAVAFATDAYVFDALLERRLPAVCAHLRAHSLPPETFLQKWFVGLCIHVLPFDVLFGFMDRFFERGFRYLFQFGLALLRALQPVLLAERNQGKLYALLRLDAGAVADASLVHAAVGLADEEDVEDVDFADMRKEAFEKHIRARMERAAQALAAREEGEENDGEDGDSGDENPVCDACGAKEASLACEDCNNAFFCQECHEKEAGDHKKDHAVSSLDDSDSDSEHSEHSD